VFRRRHRRRHRHRRQDGAASPDLRLEEKSPPPIVRLVNRFAGLSQVAEKCPCGAYFGPPDPSPPFQIHTDSQDTTCEAWRRLLDLIDEAADDGREAFIPGAEMPDDMWRQIVTLPTSIAKLGSVKRLILYGSNLIALPPEIGEMAALEDFQPYTSRRLHWFPYEITRCSALRESTVSTRNTYGNFHYRMPFPALSAAVPIGSTPSSCSSCSVCQGPPSSAGFIQIWISLRVATDVLLLLVHACSEDCVRALATPPRDYVDRPHGGGPELVQPEPFFARS
jgi:hypothetical protein